MRGRVALIVGGALAAAGVLNYLVVESVAPGEGARTMLVDLAAGVLATALCLWLTARYEAGIRRISSGLAEVARGRRDLRFDVSKEPLIANLAHCANEALSALAEPVDPSIGPVRVRKRGVTDPKAPALSEHPELGEVRAIKRNGTTSDPALMAAPPSNPTPVPATSGRLIPLGEAAARIGPNEDPSARTEPPPLSSTPMPAPAPPAAASSPPAPVDHGDRLTPLPPPGPELPVPALVERPVSKHASAAPPILAPTQSLDPINTPSRSTPVPEPASRAEHYKTVFEEYRASLTRLGTPDADLTLDGFVETLTATEKTLVDKHGCRAVRFSVLVEDGRVQLLPRLVR